MSRGRPKGYSPYVDITYEELGDYLGRKSFVKVGKAWLDELLARSASSDICYQQSIEPKQVELKQEDKIEYKITEL